MKNLVTCLALVAILLSAAGAVEAGTIHLGIAVDVSGSILDPDFNTVRTALGSAIAGADWSGSTYELSIVMFGAGASTVYDGAIDNTTKAGIGATVTAMDRTGLTSQTNMHAGITLLNTLVDYGDTANDNHIYNIISDGLPNTGPSGGGSTNGKNDAIDAKDAAIALGLEELSAEFIGAINTTPYLFLKNDMVFPTPADAPPYDPGFIVAVTPATIGAALRSKLAAVGAPSAIPLPSAAWLGLVMLGGLGLTRLRRRRD